VIPWIVFAVVVVPLVVVGFFATRRRTATGEHPATEDAQVRARTEQEFAEAEAYEAEWREKDKVRLPPGTLALAVQPGVRSCIATNGRETVAERPRICAYRSTTPRLWTDWRELCTQMSGCKT
jgi:hypothetical protein